MHNKSEVKLYIFFFGNFGKTYSKHRCMQGEKKRNKKAKKQKKKKQKKKQTKQTKTNKQTKTKQNKTKLIILYF